MTTGFRFLLSTSKNWGNRQHFDEYSSHGGSALENVEHAGNPTTMRTSLAGRRVLLMPSCKLECFTMTLATTVKSMSVKSTRRTASKAGS